jgi:hypothetical protein
MADPHRWRGAHEGRGRRLLETPIPALVGPWVLNLAHPRQAVNGHPPRPVRARGRNRTRDIFITSEVLYQLSYSGGRPILPPPR